MVIWVIGMAGAGKTTVSRALYDELKQRHDSLVFLDGDMIRDVMGEDLGHTVADRKRNADRICRLCRLLDRQGIHVICAILSIFHESQQWNRDNYRQYFEVFLDVSMETLIRRNQKALYTDALAGKITDVVGVDILFDPPKAPDFIVDNDQERSDFAALAREIVGAMPEFE